jgi:hypothetical protein
MNRIDAILVPILVFGIALIIGRAFLLSLPY